MSQPPTDLLLEVRSIDEAGHGVAEHLGRVVKIKGALPGEAVTARILRKRKGMLLAEARDISAPHQDRRRPRCIHYPRCGGCTTAHLDYAAQLELKQQMLRSELAQCGIQVEHWAAPVGGPQLAYRRKARLGVKQLASGVVVGFRESFSARVGRLQRCETLVSPFGESIPAYAALIESLSIPDRIAQLELAAGDTERQIVVRHLAPLNAADLVLLEAFEASQDTTMLLQSGGPDTISTLRGDPPALLRYALPRFGLSFEFAATDFTQVNAWMNQRITADIAALVAGFSADRAIDLFCGIGNLSLPLARSGMQVVGLEAGATAVERARHNADRNGSARRCEFAVADLYDPAAAGLPAAQVLVLDPPRSGAGPNLAAWLSSGVKEVVYLSCNPKTFATDASVLERAGFALTRVGIYDMFPQTSHVEALGVFRR